MKSSALLTTVSILATSVLAQTACDAAASAIPTCGVPCISSAASAVGCTNGDYRCRCSSAEVIQSSAIGCVIGACGIPAALEVQASGSAVCACVATATGSVVAITTAF